MNLYIVRHGETPPGEHIDPALTERGITQAECLGERLRAVALDCVLVSPLQRTVETAGAVAVRQNTRTELFPALLEVGTKPGYTGQAFTALQGFCPSLLAATSGLYGNGLPAGETMSLAYARAQQVIACVRSRFAEEATVLLVAHGSFNNLLLLAALGLPPRKDFNFSQNHTGLSLVRFLTDNGHPHTKLAFMNDTAHCCGV